uniref:Uncharacterized protein n=1 Tax=Tetranychus urticae TaxID=32264 RepID=T1K3X1_TETUR
MQVKVSSLNVLFCLIGCLYQIYGITKSYLQFKVRHDVAYDYSFYVELPAIDIMVPMPMAMDWTKVLANQPEMQDYCEKLKVKYEGSNYTIDDRNRNCEEYIYLMFLEKVPFVTSDDLPYKMNVKKIRDDTVDLTKLVKPAFLSWSHPVTNRDCEFVRYHNGLAIFMRIFCHNGSRPFLINNNLVLINKGVVAGISYAFGLHFGIRFSDPADLPEYDQSKYLMITRKPGLFPIVKISFVKTVMSSLEYPYETNCRHYNKAKSLSKCMDKYTLSQYPPYLDKFSVRGWNEHRSYLGFSDSRNEGEKVSHDELDAFIRCNQQATATECKKTDYLVEGKFSDEAVLGRRGAILIVPSLNLNMYRSAHPVLPWDEYVIYIGSIVGFWFGISMYDPIFKICTVLKNSLTSKCDCQE